MWAGDPPASALPTPMNRFKKWFKTKVIWNYFCKVRAHFSKLMLNKKQVLTYIKVASTNKEKDYVHLRTPRFPAKKRREREMLFGFGWAAVSCQCFVSLFN